MCPRGKIPPQTRVLASLKLNYIWSYTIAAIYSNDTKHILTSVMLTHAKLIPSLNVAFDAFCNVGHKPLAFVLVFNHTGEEWDHGKFPF